MKELEPEISDAYKRGFAARLEECGLDFNPFGHGPGYAGEESRNNASWNAGWFAADKELPEIAPIKEEN